MVGIHSLLGGRFLWLLLLFVEFEDSWLSGSFPSLLVLRLFLALLFGRRDLGLADSARTLRLSGLIFFLVAEEEGLEFVEGRLAAHILNRLISLAGLPNKFDEDTVFDRRLHAQLFRDLFYLLFDLHFLLSLAGSTRSSSLVGEFSHIEVDFAD
jgi:hypothetical protein